MLFSHYRANWVGGLWSPINKPVIKPSGGIYSLQLLVIIVSTQIRLLFITFAAYYTHFTTVQSVPEILYPACPITLDYASVNVECAADRSETKMACSVKLC